MSTWYPNWLLGLIAATEEYEDCHPKISEPGWQCLGRALGEVPNEARAQARGWAQAKRDAAVDVASPADDLDAFIAEQQTADPGFAAAYDRAAEAEATQRNTTAPEDGHRYACCGKVGRISRHEPWCPLGIPADVAPPADGAV